jgi:hypothetical protein
VKDHISYLNKMAGKIRVFCLIFVFLDTKWKGRYSQLSDSKHSKNFISLRRQYWVAPFITRDIPIFPHCLRIFIFIVIFLLLMASCKHISSFAKTLKLQNMSCQIFNIFQPIKFQRNMKWKFITHNYSNDNEVQYHSHQNDRIQRHTMSDNQGQLWRSHWTLRFKCTTSGSVPVVIWKWQYFCCSVNSDLNGIFLVTNCISWKLYFTALQLSYKSGILIS